MDEVIANVRSLLISTKGNTDLRTLTKDYKMMMGHDVPYRDLGFPTLDSFLSSCPGRFNISKGLNGQIVVDAVTDSKTSHIVSLVNKQRTTKKKKPFTHKGPPRRRIRNPSNSGWRPATSGKKWKPAFEASLRPAAVAHNQIVYRDRPSTSEQQIPKKSFKVQPRNTIASPRSRVANKTTKTNSVDSDASSGSDKMKNSPSPPPEVPKVEKSITSRLTRTISNPNAVNGTSGVRRLDSDPGIRYAPQHSVDSMSNRPRMRSQPSCTNMPTFSNPTSTRTVVFPQPTLTPAQVAELKTEALAFVDTSNPVWHWSSSNESSPRSFQSSSSTDSPSQIPPRYDNVISLDAISELHQFVMKHNMEKPITKIKPRIEKNGKTWYDCCIKIDGCSYSSYPEDFFAPQGANMAAAAKALVDLKEKFGKQEHLLLSTEKDILERIPPIIEKHFSGVWATQLELDYEDMYKEQLPANWLTLVDTMPTISVEPNIANKYVLRHCKVGEKNKPNCNSQLSTVSVPSNTVKVSEEGCFVQVTCAISTVEVWCRQLCTEEADKYETMCAQMESYYQKVEESVSDIYIGGFYVVHYEDCWTRVRALQIIEDEVMCFSIDYGDEYLVPKTDIYVLHRQFARQQAQAFVCSLAGLEELVNVSSTSKSLEKIIGKVYSAQPVWTPQTEEGADHDPILSVVLWDTSGSKDININKQLITQINIDSADCKLDKNHINKVYVTHSETSGIVYIQLHSEGYEKFNELMADLVGTDFETEIPNLATDPTKDLPDQLYLTKWSEDGGYYRCKILDRSPDREYAQIYFVDYGNIDIIKLRNSVLYPLEMISDVLCLFPYQAVKVKIDIEPSKLTPKFDERILSLLPCDQPVLLKVNREMDNISYCEFFKRSEADNVLFSVNASLQLETEISEAPEDEPVPSSGLLKTPDLPQINAFFDVRIPCAVSPWNFFVQPNESGEKLKDLMMRLQDKYKKVTYSTIQIEDVVPGRIYTSKHDDGIWYRTSVIKVIHSGSISVFYCDVGYYANLTLKQLVPLDQEFMDLPFQAIKAKLAGIKPRNLKWSMEDCKYFEKLVCRKTFVSILVDIQKDELYKYDIILSLKLFDTSNLEDIHLDKHLIEQGIAVADTVDK